jgi:uncharacterized integral membrane protein
LNAAITCNLCKLRRYFDKQLEIVLTTAGTISKEIIIIIIIIIILLLLLQALNFPVESFGLLNDLFSLPSILDAGYPVF